MLKVYQEFINKVERFIPEQSSQIGNKEIDLVNLFQTSPMKELLEYAPSALGIFNNLTWGYEYITDNIKEINGYDKSILLGPGGMEAVLSTFKTEHAEIYNKYIFPMIYEYFNKHSKSGNITKHRFTSLFEIKTAEGKSKWCLQQIRVIGTDENKFPSYSLISIIDVTGIKKDTDVDFIISRKDDDGVFKNIYAISIPVIESPISFSKREIEILSFIKQGFNSNEIAEALTISEHTVNTHRRNILKKSNGLNMIEIVQTMNNKNFLNN